MKQELITQTTSILKELIQTKTVQPAGNELELVEKINALFPDSVEKKIFDHGMNRASLLIKIEGHSSAKSLAFAGHLDTVALGDLRRWTYDPLLAHEENEVIYVRGAADMKSGVAAMISTGLYLVKKNQKPTKDIFFLFTADEEAQGQGIISIVNSGMIDRVSDFVITEPSNMQIGIGEKGALWLRVNAKGISCHASSPDVGKNALDVLIEFYKRVSKFVDIGDEHYYLGHNTVALTILNGGNMTNIIPGDATMELDIRTLPYLNNDIVLEGIQEIANEIIMENDNEVQLQIEIINNRSAAETKESAEIVQRFQSVFLELGLKPEIRGLKYYTDMSQIVDKMDASFVIIGPGDDKQAHQIDEHVFRKDLETMTEIFINYCERYYLQ